MILLDTNVVSELTKPEPHPSLLDWYAENMHKSGLPCLVISEIYFGLARMDDGKRKQKLYETYDEIVSVFHDRTYVFDVAAAYVFAELSVACEKAGKAIDTIDGQIAAIAKSRDLPIATRDGRDFDAAGVKIINPWTYKNA